MTIEELASKYHWFKIGEDEVIELYLDHHALSTHRMCEAKFDLEIMQNYRGKGSVPWSLNFGTVFHKCVEMLYALRATGNFEFSTMLQLANQLWVEHDLDQYSEHKTFIALGGLPGFLVLLQQYAHFYSQESERLRPIGVEIPFGKNKEVPIGEFEWHNNDLNYYDPGWYNKVRCYLTGRLDFLMDSGSAIGPMDHKTKAFFKGNPADDHDPQEGMTGYVYAANHIIKHQFPELLQSRKVDRIWMNYVQVKQESDFNKRFKRIPIFKTDYQLEQYRLRQLSTFERIFSMVTTNRTPDWNTSVCGNTFHQDCTFKGLHRQNTERDMFRILENDFYKAPAWDPDNVEERDKVANAN